MLLSVDAALNGLLDVIEMLPKFSLYIHLPVSQNVNYYIITY